MTIIEAKTKLVVLAQSQLGYHENGTNYTKYAADPLISKLYGWTPQYQPWCCTFVNWCFLTAFGYDLGSALTYGGTAACNSSAELFKQHGAFVHFPEVGDQAFFYSGGGINHTGIVVSVDGSRFTTIEGNYSDKVSQVEHNIGDSNVAGFGRPHWELVEDKPEETPEKNPVENPGGKPVKDEHSLVLPLLKQSNSYSKYCVLLQALLNARNFNCGEADGIYGAMTIAAVNAAQKYFNIQVDGECGPVTWAALGIQLKRGE